MPLDGFDLQWDRLRMMDGEVAGAGAGVDNLLLETGDNLLLESGSPDVLLLE